MAVVVQGSSKSSSSKHSWYLINVASTAAAKRNDFNVFSLTSLDVRRAKRQPTNDDDYHKILWIGVDGKELNTNQAFGQLNVETARQLAMQPFAIQQITAD